MAPKTITKMQIIATEKYAGMFLWITATNSFKNQTTPLPALKIT